MSAQIDVFIIEQPAIEISFDHLTAEVLVTDRNSIELSLGNQPISSVILNLIEGELTSVDPYVVEVGIQGLTGAQGIQGERGERGQDGAALQSIEVTQDGSITALYADGRKEGVGQITYVPPNVVDGGTF